MSRRALGGVVLVATLLSAASSPAAPLEEVLMPPERYHTSKAQALAASYRPQLVQIYENIYHCIPWVDLQKNGIGFRTPRWAAGDDRYLSVWIWIDQQDDGTFGKLTAERRASAMMSRYGVELLRRMAALKGVARDTNVEGFSVILSWLKPGSGRVGTPLVNETLALFSDRGTTLDFLAKKIAGSDFLDRSRFNFFDGQDEIGRVPIEIWEDTFLKTFKLQNYQPPPNQHC